MNDLRVFIASDESYRRDFFEVKQILPLLLGQTNVWVGYTNARELYNLKSTPCKANSTMLTLYSSSTIMVSMQRDGKLDLSFFLDNHHSLF